MNPHTLPGPASLRALCSKPSTAGWPPRLLSLAVWLAPLALMAQSYSLDWWNGAGGGGTSTGGVYSASGTIGQADAGTAMSSGQFSAQGGFWVLGVVQDTNAPTLTLWRTATNTLVLAWPVPPEGFTLRETVDLSSPAWTDVAVPPVVAGGRAQVTLPVPAGNRFYRLRR